MSIEAIKGIAAAEQQAEQILAAAAVEAKDMLVKAHSDADIAKQQAVKQAKQEIDKKFKEQEREATEGAGYADIEAARLCNELRQKADLKVISAVQFVIDKVVNDK